MKKITFFSISIFFISVFVSCNSYEREKKQTSWDLNEKDSLPFFDDIHLCTELIPDTEYINDYSKIDTLYYIDNQGQIDSLVQYIGDLQEKTNAAIATELLWTNYKTLQVKFLDGDNLIINRVINSAKQWERHCGIRFLFGDYPDPDITISFLQKGSWSYIGSYCKKMSPSMNLGWLTINTAENELDRVVLHEFGHAIGLIHEHLSPNASFIQWNKEKVYQYYKRPPNRWDKATVNRNIFNKYSSTQTNATEFDSLSIMLYAIPKELTINGFFTKSNTKLSEKDIDFIKIHYPN